MRSPGPAGRQTAYYPSGRATQRPTTLAPAPHERPEHVLADWTRNAALLDDLWSSLGEDQCGVTVTEPPVGDGFRWIVSVDGDRVRSAPAGPTVARARATISGTRRDLLALLLGRRRRRPLEIHGDLDFGAAFERAFPGP